MRFVRVVGCVLLWALLATACSSDNSAEPAPFDAVLIDLFGTDDTEAYLVEIERTAAELVAECMDDAGFEFYIPPLAESFEPPTDMDLEAAEELGFGIIAGFRFQLSQFDLGASGIDPNVIYINSLSQAEFDRFYFVLEGAEAEPGQLRTGGCNTKAGDEAFADWRRFNDALPNFTAIGEERDTHPDWLAARATWRDCMTDRGFDYSEPEAIRSDVITRMRETVNAVYPGGQVPVIEVDGVPTVDPSVDVILNELVQFEQQAAVANIECTEPVAGQFDSVERLVQQNFVERNQEAIDELLAARG